ncbi:hypothetical protein B481_0133 [Planococcus halocryophilus Or1]|nr:hypothetical protein B481_0133 [Planococcus halocryophilus Or1]
MISQALILEGNKILMVKQYIQQAEYRVELPGWGDRSW